MTSLSPGLARRVAWLGFLSITVLYVVGIALAFTSQGPEVSTWGSGGNLIHIPAALSTFTFPVVGILILVRHPRNSIGWICLAIGLVWGLDGTLSNYAGSAVATDPGRAAYAAAADSWLWLPAAGLMGIFLILPFPEGHLPSPRWKILAWLSAVTIVLGSLGLLFAPRSLTGAGYPHLANPWHIASLQWFFAPLQAVIVLLPLEIVAVMVAAVQRFRRSRGRDRLQMKWLTAGAAAVALLYLVAMIAALGYGSNDSAVDPIWIQLLEDAALFSFALIPAAIGIAILKHHLYNIDVIINKTVLFGALAAFITLVYVAIVVGIGSVFGSGGKPNLALSIIATAVVAIAFQPVRERVQHFANRLVYGNRATPYEILSQFSDRVAENYATEDVLPRMARTVAEGTGAAHAEVWMRSEGKLRCAATWPEGAARDPGAFALSDGQLPSFQGIDKAIPVRHQGELLGALTVTKPPGEPLTPAEEGLLADLASQAGLVLRNVGLTAELLQRLDELKASRQRLVATQDQERRRLERDLHDGAQQHLVALRTRLALAERLTERDPGKAEEMIATLEQQAGEALDTLRDLARGIYPPLLADQGLKAALEAQARSAPVAVEVHGEDIARYPQEIEAAVYFCCLEALQNVGKYAAATEASIELSVTDDALQFVVRDNGQGFDPRVTSKGSGTQNMADRVAAIGGSLTVESAPGEGTAVLGTIPARDLEPVA